MMTRSDYVNLYYLSKLELGHDPELRLACNKILNNQTVYKSVADQAQVPWLCVAILHFRESGFDFTKHLHNGDPLTARTIRVPAGRPILGNAPFDWVDSAVDAIHIAWKPPGPVEWNVGTALAFFEHYNGMGYQIKHKINSPYVWNYTSAYSSGLYASDGQFDPNLVSKQAGCAAILKQLENQGIVLDFSV